MKPLMSFSVACLFGLAMPAGMAAATTSSATHQHTSSATVPAQAGRSGQRFATDAPLREGMARIRQSMQALGHYEHGHLGPERAVQLADSIEQDVRFLIANCKLEPAADAALHGIIARLLQGAAALKADAKDLPAIEPMRAALADYALTFDDPVVAAD